MRPNNAAFGAQTARGAAFAWDTHISAPHARTIASHPTNVCRGMRSASRSTAHNQEARQATNTCTRERLQEPTIHRREPRRAHQHRNPWTKRAHQVLFGTADRDRAMILPMKSTKTAIRVDGEDVGGSLQHAPSMDSMSAPASTAPMNFSATSSASQPSPRTPKQRRHGGQRDEDPSSQRPDPAFKRPFLPHSPPSLSLDFGQGRTTRCYYK